MPEGQRRWGQETTVLSEGSPCSPCIHSKRCAAGLLACLEFQTYVGTPGSGEWKGPTIPERDRDPTRGLYVRVHAHYPTKGETAWRKAGRARMKGPAGN